MDINYQTHTYVVLYMHTTVIYIFTYTFFGRPRACCQSVSSLTVNCFPCSCYLYCQVFCRVSDVMRLWCLGCSYLGWPGALISGLRHTTPPLKPLQPEIFGNRTRRPKRDVVPQGVDGGEAALMSQWMTYAAFRRSTENIVVIL
jgi:hypothetical protein